jgi:Protein of unknown function (DUF2637)
VTGRADLWIRRTTIGCVGLLALIAGTVSYLHMHLLVEIHGQPGWVAALTPLSVDGMIVAASTTLLADSRNGGRGGFLPWALLVAGSAASLAAIFAVAEPKATMRAEADKLMRSLGHEASGRASHLLAECAIEAELDPMHARIAELDGQMQPANARPSRSRRPSASSRSSTRRWPPSRPPSARSWC